MIKVYTKLHKVPSFLSDFNETWIFSTYFQKKTSNTKFHENPSSGSPVVSHGQKDGHTWRCT